MGIVSMPLGSVAGASDAPSSPDGHASGGFSKEQLASAQEFWKKKAASKPPEPPPNPGGFTADQLRAARNFWESRNAPPPPPPTSEQRAAHDNAATPGGIPRSIAEMPTASGVFKSNDSWYDPLRRGVRDAWDATSRAVESGWGKYKNAAGEMVFDEMNPSGPFSRPTPRTDKEKQDFVSTYGKTPEQKAKAEQYLKTLDTTRAAVGSLMDTGVSAAATAGAFMGGEVALSAAIPKDAALIKTLADIGFTGQMALDTAKSYPEAKRVYAKYGADSPEFATYAVQSGVNALFAAMGAMHLAHASAGEFKEMLADRKTAALANLADEEAKRKFGKGFTELDPEQKQQTSTAVASALVDAQEAEASHHGVGEESVPSGAPAAASAGGANAGEAAATAGAEPPGDENPAPVVPRRYRRTEASAANAAAGPYEGARGRSNLFGGSRRWLGQDPFQLPEASPSESASATDRFLASLGDADRRVVADWLGADPSRGFYRRARRDFIDRANLAERQQALPRPANPAAGWSNGHMWQILRDYAEALRDPASIPPPAERTATAPRPAATEASTSVASTPAAEVAAAPQPAPAPTPENPSAGTPAATPPPVTEGPPVEPVNGSGMSLSAPSPGSVGMMRTEDIAVDPGRFQFKLAAVGPGGTSASLRNVSGYRPELAGAISVWTDPVDGKTYVVNGHHRLELASRMGQPSVAVLSIDAPTAEKARAVGALQNIAEGHGSPVDAAKFMRDAGMGPEDLRRAGLPIGERHIADAAAIAKLDPGIFDQVVSGKLRMGRAVAIGEGAETPQQQWDILKLVKDREAKGKTVSDDVLAELIRLVKSSGTHEATQDSLFGAQDIGRSLAFEKAELSAYVRKQLGEERRAFGAVSNEDRAARLKRAGNTINAAENARIAAAAARSLELYDRLSSRVGPVADALEEGARELADGKSPAEVRSRVYRRVRAAVAKQLGSDLGTVARKVSPTPPQAPPQDDRRLASIAERLPDVAKVTPEQKMAVAHVIGAFAQYRGVTPEALLDGIELRAAEAGEVPDHAKGQTILVDGAKTVVRLAKSRADVSTWVHELSHTFLPMLKPEDRDIIWQWVGAEPGTSVHALTTAQHEKFARGFERYLADGKAPAPGLKSVFESFRNWMLSIYGSISKAHELNVRLSPEARKVYAQILGAEPIEGEKASRSPVATAPPRPRAIATARDSLFPGIKEALDLIADPSTRTLNQPWWGPSPSREAPEILGEVIEAGNNWERHRTELGSNVIIVHSKTARLLARAGLDGFTVAGGATVSGRPRTALGDDPLVEVANGVARDDGPVAVVASQPGLNSTADVRRTLAHELHHVWQFRLRRAGEELFASNSDIERLARHPVAKRMENFLRDNGYGSHPTITVMETAARIAASGHREALASPREAASFLDQYFSAIVAAHGPEAINKLESLSSKEFNHAIARAASGGNEAAKATGEGAGGEPGDVQAAGAVPDVGAGRPGGAGKDARPRTQGAPVGSIDSARPAVPSDEELLTRFPDFPRHAFAALRDSGGDYSAFARRMLESYPDSGAELKSLLPIAWRDLTARPESSAGKVAGAPDVRQMGMFGGPEAKPSVEPNLPPAQGSLFQADSRLAGAALGQRPLGRSAPSPQAEALARGGRDPWGNSYTGAFGAEWDSFPDSVKATIAEHDIDTKRRQDATVTAGAAEMLSAMDYPGWRDAMERIIGKGRWPGDPKWFYEASARELDAKLTDKLAAMQPGDPEREIYEDFKQRLLESREANNEAAPPITEGPPAQNLLGTEGHRPLRETVAEAGAADHGPGRAHEGVAGVQVGRGDAPVAAGRVAEGPGARDGGAAQPADAGVRGGGAGVRPGPGGDGGALGRGERDGAAGPGRGNRGGAIAARAADATVAKPEAVKVKPVKIEDSDRDWGPAVYSAGDWKDILKAANVPEGTPIPSVSFRPDIRAKLIGEQPIVGEVALSSLRQRGGALIATPTGSGKAYMSSAIVAELRPRRTLAITAGKTLPLDLMDVMRGFGLDPKPLPRGGEAIPDSGLFVTNYESLYDGKAKRFRSELAKEHWDLVVADESDKARNWHMKVGGATGQLVRKLTGSADKALYLSASPFHTALDAGYLDKLGMWKKDGFADWGRQFGIRVRRDGTWWAPPNAQKVASLRARMIEAGVMATSDMDMEGHKVQFAMSPLSDERVAGAKGLIDGFRMVENYYSSEGQVGKARVMRAQVATYLKSYLERSRLAEAVDLARRARDKGYQVVVHSGNFDDKTPDEYKLLHTTWEDRRSGMARGNPAVGDAARAMIPNLPSIPEAFAKEFGDEFVDFSGGGSDAKREELARWNRGDARVMFASYAMGGRGVGMHDTSPGGIRPRFAIHLGLPYDGFTLMQALGRPWRKRTTSDVISAFLMSDAEPDVKLIASKIGPRLGSLRAAVSGMRYDDPVLKNFEKIAPDSTAGYEFEDADKPSVERFTRRAKTDGIQRVDDLAKSLPQATEQMGKGIAWAGRGAGRIDLQQALDASREARTRELSRAETAKAKQSGTESAATAAATAAEKPQDRDSLPAAPPPPAPPPGGSGAGGGERVPPPGSTAPPPPPSPGFIARRQRAYEKFANAVSYHIGLGRPFEAIERAGFKDVAEAFNRVRVSTFGHAARSLAGDFVAPLDELSSKLWPGSDPESVKVRNQNQLKAMALFDTATSADWKRENPAGWKQAADDSKLQKMVAELERSGFDPEMTRMRRFLGGTLIAGNHITRAYLPSADMPEAAKLRLAAERGELDAWDPDMQGRGSQPLPQRPANFARYASAEYYLKNGDPDFGHAIAPAFERTEKMYQKQLAWNAMIAESAPVTGKAPDTLVINGKTYYSAEAAARIKADKNAGKAKGLPDKPPQYRIVKMEYSPEKTRSALLSLFRAGRDVGKRASDLRSLINGLEGAIEARHAVPAEIAQAWNDMGKHSDDYKVSDSAIGRFLQGASEFVKNQLFFVGFGLRHSFNIARRLTEMQGGGVASPLAWAKTIDALAINSKVKERAKLGGFGTTADAAQFRELLRSGGVVGDRYDAFMAYGEANSRWNKAAQFGHKWLFGKGGLDTRARIYADDLLRAARPDKTARERSDAINAALGRISRASRTDKQNAIGQLFMFPGWDFSTVNWVIQHPIKTTVAPAAVMLATNLALQYLKASAPGKTELTAIDIGGHQLQPATLSEWVARRFANGFLQPANAAAYALSRGEGLPGAERAFSGSFTPSTMFGNPVATAEDMMNPILTTAVLLGTNHTYPGQEASTVYPSDYKRKPLVIPGVSRATEKRILVATSELVPMGSTLFQSMVRQHTTAAIKRDLLNDMYTDSGLYFGVSNYAVPSGRR